MFNTSKWLGDGITEVTELERVDTSKWLGESLTDASGIARVQKKQLAERGCNRSKRSKRGSSTSGCRSCKRSKWLAEGGTDKRCFVKDVIESRVLLMV